LTKTDAEQLPIRKVASGDLLMAVTSYPTL